MDRVRHDVNGVPEEMLEMAGSTGNLYTVKISLQPACTCPDSMKGNQCKHIIYVRCLAKLQPRVLTRPLRSFTKC